MVEEPPPKIKTVKSESEVNPCKGIKELNIDEGKKVYIRLRKMSGLRNSEENIYVQIVKVEENYKALKQVNPKKIEHALETAYNWSDKYDIPLFIGNVDFN